MTPEERDYHDRLGHRRGDCPCGAKDVLLDGRGECLTCRVETQAERLKGLTLQCHEALPNKRALAEHVRKPHVVGNKVRQNALSVEELMTWDFEELQRDHALLHAPRPELEGVEQA